MNASRATAPAPAPGDERFDSWKEIAAYFRRTEATVRRWEKDGLPIHRHLLTSRSRVFAYKSELDAWWRQAPESAEPGEPVLAASSSVPVLRRSVWRWRWAGPRALFLVCVIASLLWVSGSRSPSSPMTLTPFMTMEGDVSDPAFSPDGNELAFAWASPGESLRQIYVKLIGSEAPLRLTHNDEGEDFAPVWSPDGKQIAFLRGTTKDFEIVTVPALGGPERRLLSLRTDRYFGLDWTPDGKQIAFAQRTSADHPYAVFLLSITDGRLRQVTFPPAHGAGDMRFAISPDGSALAVLRHGEAPPVSIEIVPIRTEVGRSKPHAVASYHEWIGSLAWADDRSLVISGNRDGIRRLWRLDVESGREQEIEATGQDAYFPAVSRQRHRLAFVRTFEDSDLWRAELVSARGPAGVPVRLNFSTRVEGAPRFSPDGRKIAFQSYRSGTPEIWVSDPDGGNGVQLTFLKTTTPEMPSWSPDGRMIAFAGGGDHVISVANGQGRRLSAKLQSFGGPSWSRDGRYVYFWRADQPGPVQIWKVSSSGGDPVQVTKKGGFSSMESPDGKLLYFTKQTVKGIWSMPVGGGDEKLVLDEFEPSFPGYWAVVDDGIYYLDYAVKPRPVITFFDFATGKHRPILALPGEPDGWFGGLTVSLDRHWIVFSQQQYSSSELVLAENFR